MHHYELGNLIIAQDRSIFTVHPGDEQTLAPLTIKDYKELGISLNALQERILLLVSENDALRGRIETLERNLNDFSGAVCACIAGEEGVD